MRDFQAAGRSVAVGSRGAAATSQPLSTYVAIEVLRNGGNAVDAALTACSLQSILEPHNTGIGGDCFAFVWREDRGELFAVNGAGWAPAALDTHFLLKSGIGAIDPSSVHAAMIPGALDAWARLLADHGTLSLADVLEPTIAYAESGIVLAERSAFDWGREVAKLGRDEGARAQLLFNGKAPSAGDRVRFPLLARTLRIIAAEGPDAFYRGPVARDLLATLSALGGRHSFEDFASYASTYVEPIGVNYRGVRVLQMPPSGQGLTALVMLNILSGFAHAHLAPAGAERLHLQIEAARLAYTVRDAFIADPEFESVPVAELLSPSFADALRERIRLDRAGPMEPSLPAVSQRDTICLTVVDGAGNACSLVNSLFDAFGCGKVCPRTGVVFQSRGAGFRVAPGHPNTIAGHKRPLHTIMPGIALRDGKPFLSFGVMGGAFQPVGQVQLLQDVVDFDMDVQTALSAPRGFRAGPIFEAERGVPDKTLTELARLGHQVGRAAYPFGGGQAIEIDRNRGILEAGSDPRKDGIALAI